MYRHVFCEAIEKKTFRSFHCWCPQKSSSVFYESLQSKIVNAEFDPVSMLISLWSAEHV